MSQPNRTRTKADPRSAFSSQQGMNKDNALSLSPAGGEGGMRGVLIRTAAGTAGFLQAGCDLVAGAPVAFDKINLNGFDLFEKLFIDGKRNSIFLKNFIFCDWFIQNHAQRGPRSTSLGQHDSDRRGLISLLEVILHHCNGFFGYLKHSFLLFNAFGPFVYFFSITNSLSKPYTKNDLKMPYQKTWVTGKNSL